MLAGHGRESRVTRAPRLVLRPLGANHVERRDLDMAARRGRSAFSACSNTPTTARCTWMRRSLLRNLCELPIFDFSTTLTEDQLAPPGFLVVERIMVRLPFPKVWAARLIPLLCGIASMFLMRSVARRYLSPRAVPIAVGLFALDDWLLYYSAEIKQYCSDIALTLVALLLASAPADYEPAEAPRSRRLRCGRRLVLASAGPGARGRGNLPGGQRPRFASDWTKSVGPRGNEPALGRQLRDLLLCFASDPEQGPIHLGLVGLCVLADSTPLACRPRRATSGRCSTFSTVPRWVLTPLGVRRFGVSRAGVVLDRRAVAGPEVARRSLPADGPVLFTLLASALHQYPFHGRLLLFLVPTIHLLVGEGAAALGRRGGAHPHGRSCRILARSAGERGDLAPVDRATLSRSVRLARRPLARSARLSRTTSL